MKIRVTTAFNDRQNGYVTRPVNEVFECSEQRAKELIDGGFAEEVKSDAPKKPRTKAVKTEKQKSGLSTLRICKVLFYCPKTLNYGRHRAKLKQRDTL